MHGLSALRQSWSVHRFIDDRRYWYRYTDPWIWDKGSLSQFRIGRKGKTQKLLLFAGYGLSSSVRLEKKYVAWFDDGPTMRCRALPWFILGCVILDSICREIVKNMHMYLYNNPQREWDKLDTWKLWIEDHHQHIDNILQKQISCFGHPF